MSVADLDRSDRLDVTADRINDSARHACRTTDAGNGGNVFIIGQRQIGQLYTKRWRAERTGRLIVRASDDGLHERADLLVDGQRSVLLRQVQVGEFGAGRRRSAIDDAVAAFVDPSGGALAVYPTSRSGVDNPICKGEALRGWL